MSAPVVCRTFGLPDLGDARTWGPLKSIGARIGLAQCGRSWARTRGTKAGAGAADPLIPANHHTRACREVANCDRLIQNGIRLRSVNLFVRIIAPMIPGGVFDVEVCDWRQSRQS